jgi:hypothetical protein
MRASNLIKELQELLNGYGDLEVRFSGDCAQDDPVFGMAVFQPSDKFFYVCDYDSICVYYDGGMITHRDKLGNIR